MTPLEQLIERLNLLLDTEPTKDGSIAYMIAIGAAENLLDDEQRFINRIKSSN